MYYIIRYKNITCYLPLLALEFFSPTASLISIPLALLFASYFFFCKNMKQISLAFGATILSVTYGFLISLPKLSPQISSGSILWVLILFYCLSFAGLILFGLMHYFKFGTADNIISKININSK